jgi:hypothetical protein
MVCTYIIVLEALDRQLDHYHQSRVREEAMYLSGNRWVQKHADCAADRFRTDKKCRIKEIFVDETLLQIDGQNYWLWMAYEPNLDVCLMMHHLSRERTIFSYVINSSSNLGIELVVGNPFTQTVLYGTIQPAEDGLD